MQIGWPNHFNSLRISTIGLKFGGMILGNIKYCKIGLIVQCLCVPHDFEVVHDMIMRYMIAMLPLWLSGFQLLAWNYLWWCILPVHGTTLFQMSILGYFSATTELWISNDRLGPGRWHILGYVRKSHHGLKFGAMMQWKMERRVNMWYTPISCYVCIP